MKRMAIATFTLPAAQISMAVDRRVKVGYTECQNSNKKRLVSRRRYSCYQGTDQTLNVKESRISRSNQEQTNRRRHISSTAFFLNDTCKLLLARYISHDDRFGPRQRLKREGCHTFGYAELHHKLHVYIKDLLLLPLTHVISSRLKA